MDKDDPRVVLREALERFIHRYDLVQLDISWISGTRFRLDACPKQRHALSVQGPNSLALLVMTPPDEL